MPTMAAIALERLLEPHSGRSVPQKPETPFLLGHHRDGSSTAAPSGRPCVFSPALFATPDPAPLQDSPPTSVSQSASVVHRLVGFEIPDGGRRDDVPLPGMTTAVGGEGKRGAVLSAKCSVDGMGSASGCLGDGVHGLVKEEGDGDGEREEELGEDDFLDPRDSRNVTSSCSAGFGNQSPLSNQSEFYDAAEDFFSDGSVSHSSTSPSTNPEMELCALKLDLLEEIRGRKIAEKDLFHMQN